MNRTHFLFLASWLIGAAAAHAHLAVSFSPVEVTGSKALVKLELKNTFAEKVESVRASCFLLDEQGKLVGQGTRWIIGGSNTNGLAAAATNTFHFVITSPDSAGFPTTNLTAKVTVNRIVLESGKLADVTKDVRIQNVGD